MNNEELFSRTLPDDVNTEKKLLLDWYTATLATVDGGSYYEITLSIGSDGQFYFNEYIQGRTGDDSVHRVYNTTEAIKDEALKKAQEIIKRYDMNSWQIYSGTGMCGRRDVFKFYNEKSDRLTRVSTDNMPDNGPDAFQEVEKIMNHYMKKAIRVK